MKKKIRLWVTVGKQKTNVHFWPGIRIEKGDKIIPWWVTHEDGVKCGCPEKTICTKAFKAVTGWLPRPGQAVEIEIRKVKK